MCLTIDKGPFIAKEDFYTLKLAEFVRPKYCLSFYQGMKQYYNKLYKAKLEGDETIITKGLHSYQITSDYKIVSYDFSFRRGVILCQVPKGSIYYIGLMNDIVSNQLILVEPIIVDDKFLEEKVVNIKTTIQALNKAIKIVKSYNYNTKPS